MAKFRVAVMRGDGIGPEITNEAIKVLEKAVVKSGNEIEYVDLAIGGDSIDKFGTPLTDEAIEESKKCSAVILGAVGGYKWDSLEGEMRPESGLLKIRKALGLYANLRPLKVHPKLKSLSPIRKIADADGIGADMLMVRELTGGIYFGEKGKGDDYAWDTEKYSIPEVDRVAKLSFELAKGRKSKLHSIDKANVLFSSRLWRERVVLMSKDYADIELEHMYVDNCAMQLIIAPEKFDVVLTSNMFGDILSDEMSALAGSIGLMPSASLGDGGIGLYEPIHGSAPDIAGMNIANPAATILSAAMLARYSLGLASVADEIEKAVDDVINDGFVTGDLVGPGFTKVSTSEFGDKVLAKI
jgi:3-isopropylmalate dehydrogenase